jgi:transcription-repair coupling factor (superfamily II helicase)
VAEASEQHDLLDLRDVARRVCARTGPLRLTGLRGAARAAVGARLVEAHGDRPILFLAATAKEADALLEDLRTALGELRPEEGGRVRAFPRHDTPAYDRFSPQPFVIAQRMDVLYRLLASVRAAPDPNMGESSAGREPAPVVVSTWSALAGPVPSRELVRARSVHLEVGQWIDRDALVETLLAAGYARMPLVEEPGELAVRGHILDIFPPQRALPLRVELLGDEVESIREFDAASQRSQGSLDYAVAPPARELLLDRSILIERSDGLRELAAAQGVGPRVVDQLMDALLRGHLPPGVESLAPRLLPSRETVFEFLPEDTLVAIDGAGGRERLLQHWDEALAHFEAAAEAGRVVAPPEELLLQPERVEAALEARTPVRLERLDLDSDDERYAVRAYGQDELRQALVRSRTREGALQPLVDSIRAWVERGQRVVLTAPALSGAERMRTLLEEYGVESRLARDPAPLWSWSAPGRVEVRVAGLSAGFVLPLEGIAVATEEEIFGRREKRRVQKSFREEFSLDALAQISTGDRLVHVEHGIGIYRGLVELEVRGVVSEMLRIEYAGGDRLFLPVHRFNLVQRYVGADGQAPRLDRLGGKTWEKAKSSVRRQLRDMANVLLSVHAARELAPGHAFSPRDRYLEEFEAAFPYEETPDQQSAIEDVLEDLRDGKPMDRLVCGDVGYGKTEVAARAAFRVVMDGKQVALLVPTTVLCDQHVETLRKRFEGYPVRIEGLSRFCTPKQGRDTLEGLATGNVDIVVGTHRLLQKSVVFRDLGLLVVDEEHRFGVAHKERIKQMRKTVDVLTLTATPIPRTLQMAFTGLRDLSVINTPPPDRMAIRTQVCRFSDSLVREAILREVRRGGQVFYVHNRVQTIASVAQMLGRIVPEVRIIVAHGQMPERQLEEKMMAFLHGQGDLLLCTTIIESGLDNPRANTILVDRADALGLAQIYQLRGRVGRSSRRAYAYLMIPGEDTLTDDARRRLEAIQDLSELGSGFRLASMDLEIRGAGNLLGAEQAGNLGAVGYETYLEMLEETLGELRGEVRESSVDPEIRLPVTARLPEAYVTAVSQRLVLYKRLASAPDEADLERIRDEILDRYGPLPQEAQNLVGVIRLKILARTLGLVSLDLLKGDLVLATGEGSRVDPERLVNLLTQADSGIQVSSDHRILMPAPRDADAGLLLGAAARLLRDLGA